MQKIVKEFNEKYMKGMSAENRMLDIVSEVGELSKEILKATDYGTKEFEVTEDLKLELGDALYSLLSFAHENGIDAEDAVKKVVDKYAKRFAKKGHIGSN